MVIKALIPETPVKAFDEGVLGGLARLNHFELNAMLVGPLVERLPGELWPLVGSDRLGVSPETRLA